MADYMPRNDAEFTIWQTNLIDIVSNVPVVWGIPAEDLTMLVQKQLVWIAAYAAASNKQNRTSADVQAKNDAGETFRKSLRSFAAQWLAYNSKVSNSDRERMGLTVKSGSRTPVPLPVSCPAGSVDFSIRLQHGIHYADESTPNRKAKPTGVHGCEIWMKIDGNTPVDSSELNYLTTDTSSPHTTTFEGKYAGKIVYYMMRWVNTRGEHGPWGSTISAMVVS